MKGRNDQILPRADFVYSLCAKLSLLIWQRYIELFQNAASGSFN